MRQNVQNAMKLSAVASTLLGSLAGIEPSFGQQQPIVHDSEYYILDAQHGERWAVEDKDLDNKLAELRKKFGHRSPLLATASMLLAPLPDRHP